jgi:hypothetical protein
VNGWTIPPQKAKFFGSVKQGRFFIPANIKSARAGGAVKAARSAPRSGLALMAPLARAMLNDAGPQAPHAIISTNRPNR